MVRRDWLSLMLKIADPVLTNLEAGILRQNLPVEKPDRTMYAHLEAFGRVLTGIAPWLGPEGLDREEREPAGAFRVPCSSGNGLSRGFCEIF